MISVACTSSILYTVKQLKYKLQLGLLSKYIHSIGCYRVSCYFRTLSYCSGVLVAYVLLWDLTHLGLLMVVGLAGPKTTQFVQEHVEVVSNTRKDTVTTQSKLTLCRLMEFFMT